MLPTKKLLFFFLFISIYIVNSNDWHSFKTTYSKVYKNAKEDYIRKQIFLENMKIIKEQNKKYEEGSSSFSVKVNKHADLAKGEIFPFPKFSVGYTSTSNNGKKLAKFAIKDVPESIDWRDNEVITPVKDQLGCESCWAFAVVGAIEAHMGIYNQQNVTLSEQNLIDCVNPTFTCEDYLDATMLDQSYQYIINNGGINTANSYPNEYLTVGPCRFSPDNVGAGIIDYNSVTEGDEEELKTVVGTLGPVAATITTDLMWGAYQGGIYYKEDCMNTTEVFNHAVVVIGYGNENGEDFWLIKNSWGTWFGEDGYIKMARNRGNNCGIASIVRYPMI